MSTIPANSNYTIPVIVYLSPNVTTGQTWGLCTSCPTVAYATQTYATGSGASIAIDTAKRVLITAVQMQGAASSIIQSSGGSTRQFNNINSFNHHNSQYDNHNKCIDKRAIRQHNNIYDKHPAYDSKNNNHK